ncbi:PAS domain S-box protein [Emticicia soli]|uniref:histidine kinase n=1 Tax=Emticicia soli TaxID=2027878 RepID=A0ABW5J605_9BACT
MKAYTFQQNLSSTSLKNPDYEDLMTRYIEESFLIVDSNLIIVNFSLNFKEQYKKYFGRIVKKGDSILDYAPKGRKEIARSFYMRAMEGEIFEIEVDLPMSDNTIFTCRNKYKPIYNKKKHILGVFVSAFDISFIRKAEAELRQNENKYRTIVENSLDAFIFRTPDGDLLDVNHAGVDMFGYSKEEFKKLNIRAIVDHSDEKYLNYLRERGKTGKMKGEATGIRKNGEHFPIEISSVAYQQVNNKILVGTFVRDISIRKNAKKQLEKSEKRFRALVENSSDILILNEESGILQYVSPAFERITGITYSELQQNPKSFSLGLHPDYADQARKIFFGALKKPGVPITCVLRFQHKEGYSVYLEGTVTNMLNDENVGAVVSNYRDVTERKLAEAQLVKSENRFKALVENASDVIILGNEKGIVQYVSPAFEKITGFTLEDAKNNLNLLRESLHPDFQEEAIRSSLEAIEKPGVPIPRLLQLKHKDGHYLWFEGFITNLLHDANVGAIVSNYRDISERKVAEDKLIKSEKRFRTLVEKGEDIIIMSNPDGIISYVSPAFERLTGYNNNEVIGKQNLLFMHEEQAKETGAIFERLLKHPELSVPRLNRIKCKNGEYIWVEGHITNLLSDDSVQAIVSNYINVTERNKITEQIRQSESNLKAIFENTSEAFVLLDTNGFIKAFNNNARLFGFLNTDNEMIEGRHILELITDDRKVIVQSFFDKVLKGEIIQYDRPYIQGDSTLWINYTIRPVIENRQIKGICTTGRDITARKVAEEEIAKREIKFRSILANSHDLLLIFDADGKIEFLSPAIQKIFGYTNSETEIPNILDSIHPEDLENVMTYLNRAFTNPEVQVFATSRVRNKEGNYLWLEGTLTNMLHKPEIHAIIASFKDVTERRVFEEQQDFNSSDDAIMSINADKTILSWNKGAEKMFGYEDKEIIGKSIYQIVPANRHYEEDEILSKIQESKPVKHYETQRLNKWGRLLEISLTASPIKDSKGNITGVSKIARDISEKKKAAEQISNNERRFRSLLQNSNEGLSLMGIDGVMHEVSLTGKKILGYDDSELIGKARYDLIHPDDIELVSQAFVDVVNDPEKTRYFEYRSLCKDGQYKWLEASCLNLLNDGAVGAIVVNFRDITERKNQEIEREQLIITLNQSNNDLRNFSFITSHNLRAPLSNLLGFTQLLEDIPVEDPILKAILEGFRTSTIQLDDTLNDLIKILIVRDNSSIEQKEIGFSQIFLQVQNQLNYLIQEAKPDIETTFEHAPSVIFNETYLESILMNLMTNAIKYRAGNRKLKIKVASQKTDKGIVLTFADNGIGFDAERQKEKVFGLYQRFHDRPDSKGFGLYLIKSQIESLGGTIEVDSAVDVGTTFKLRFKSIYHKSEWNK